MKIKSDWWLANALINIISGILFIVSRASEGMLSVGLFMGGINILIGIALLQKSMIAFWIVLIVSGSNFLSRLNVLVKNQGDYLPVIVAAITFAFALMLWQQNKSEKNIK